MVLLASDILSIGATMQNAVPNFNINIYIYYKCNWIYITNFLWRKSWSLTRNGIIAPDAWTLFHNSFNEVRKLCWRISSLPPNSFGFDTFQGLKLVVFLLSLFSLYFVFSLVKWIKHLCIYKLHYHSLQQTLQLIKTLVRAGLSDSISIQRLWTSAY